MTPDETPRERIRMARLACIIMVVVLLGFAVLGKRILSFLGIELPAFQIAGGIVLLLVALDMLRAQRSRVQETREETAAGAAKDDIAVTPLAIPMLAGPGAISTAILLRITTRIMGLLLAAIAIQFIVTALGALGIIGKGIGQN